MPSLFSALLLATSLLGADAINLLQPRDGKAPKVLRNDFHRRDIPDRFKQMQADRQRMRRRDVMTVDTELLNLEALYLINGSVGTPPQEVALHIDTGSSDLWVNTPSSSYCQQSTASCDLAGTYAPNDSSTYEYVNSYFDITYVDGTSATGDYVTDTFRINNEGVTVENLQFGVGYQASKEVGVLGIGYPIHEVAANYGGIYPNFPAKLVDYGYINTNAYSLWLNDLDAAQGEILWGGVNTAKYTGDLKTLPVIQEGDGVYAELIIALTAIGANGEEGSIKNNIEYPALLDSGTSLLYLPNEIAESIFDALNAQWDESNGAAFVDCSFASSNDTLDLTFSSPTIQVPMNELVLQTGYNTCILGIAKAGDTIPVLGDTFLRSAYVVFDLYNNEISIAQTDFYSSEDNIMEITKTNVPGATAVQNPVTDVNLPSGAAARVNGAAPGASVGLAAVLLCAGAFGCAAML